MNPNARQSHFADVKSNSEIEPCLSVLVPVYNEESTVVPVSVFPSTIAGENFCIVLTTDAVDSLPLTCFTPIISVC